MKKRELSPQHVRSPQGRHSSAFSAPHLAVGLAIAALGILGVHDLFADPDRRFDQSALLMFLGPTVLTIGLLTALFFGFRLSQRPLASFLLIGAGALMLIGEALLVILDETRPGHEKDTLLSTLGLFVLAGPGIASLAFALVLADLRKRHSIKRLPPR